jgi:L-threonylcarbamoyladenylate synthase
MAEPNTVTLPDSDRGLRAALALLRAGELVAFPTETVYGLGADARNARAVAGIFAAKGRPAFNPLIVHVADRPAADRLADFCADARALADRFWPGPLTLVLPRRDDAGLAAATTAGLPTVALRVPAHPLARRLLDAFAGPLAAPSANPSGAVSPTTAAHVRDGLAGRIAAVLDGGACPVGLESTIIGFEGTTPVLLRPGGLPRAPLRLDAAAAGPDEVRLGFGPGDPAGLNLSPSGDLAEAAANLFAHLRAADALAAARGATAIAVAPIPRAGLGAAINDRLTRAAAPRNGPR